MSVGIESRSRDRDYTIAIKSLHLQKYSINVVLRVLSIFACIIVKRVKEIEIILLFTVESENYISGAFDLIVLFSVKCRITTFHNYTELHRTANYTECN